MILETMRALRSFSRYHHIMIIITISVPLAWSAIAPLLFPGCPFLQIVSHVVAFFVLLILAELAVAVALRRDRLKTERFVSQEVEVVAGEINSLREQHEHRLYRHEGSIDDLQRQVDDQYAIFREAFEELGVDPQGRRIPIRATFTGAGGTMSAKVSVVRVSKWARFRLRLRLFGRWLKETVWGKPDHD